MIAQFCYLGLYLSVETAFLSSFATDDKDEYGLKLEKLGQHFQVLGRFPLVRTGRPVRSRGIGNFTFNQNHPSRSVKS